MQLASITLILLQESIVFSNTNLPPRQSLASSRNLEEKLCYGCAHAQGTGRTLGGCSSASLAFIIYFFYFSLPRRPSCGSSGSLFVRRARTVTRCAQPAVEISRLCSYTHQYILNSRMRAVDSQNEELESNLYQGSLAQLPKLNKVLAREFLPAAASSTILSSERTEYTFLPSTGKFLRNSLPTTNSPLISCMPLIFPGLPYLARLD